MNAISRAGALLVVSLLPMVVVAEDDFSKVEIKTTKVADGVYMLEGQGGNIGVSVGEDGVFLVDDQFAPLTDKIKAAIAVVAQKPIRFLLNTHWHFDHVGGNENLGTSGVLIIAHENVRKRMSVEQFIAAFGKKIDPSPKAALPVVTFAQDVTFHLNGDEIHAFHVAPAHTDGDVLIHFSKANVVHTGDVYFNGMYPFIDLSSDGSVQGMLDAADKVLGLAKTDTKIIPGHGALSTKAELRAYRQMLATLYGRVKALVARGKSLDEVVAAQPTKDYDEKFGKGFLSPAAFTTILYQDAAGKRKKQS